MKKLFLTLAAVTAVASTSMAQNIDVNGIKEDISKYEEASKHAKKSLKSSTWLKLGDAYLEAATAATGKVLPGAAQSTLSLTLGNQPKAKQVKVGAVEYTLLPYKMLDVYVKGGVVAAVVERKPFVEAALAKAGDAYKKAKEIDPKSGDKADKGLMKVVTAYISDANNAYTVAKFAPATTLFVDGAKLAKEEKLAVPDVELYKYFGALSAYQNKDFATAATVLEELAADNYAKDGDVYYYLGLAYETMKDNAKAEVAYQKGVEEFASNQNLLNQLIRFYITNGDDPAKVIPYIKKAQEASPNNVITYYMEGVAYQTMKDYPAAHAAYDKAKEIDPKFFDVYYNDGLAYLDEANVLIEEMNKLDVTNKTAYNDAYTNMVNARTKAAETLEKGYSINNKSRDCVELLKSVYFALRNENDDFMASYNKYNDLLKTM